ncbi:MAG: YafY family transcriptional regulator [Candidatus Eisenbacteria bacterium]|uniref:YafY family transcriptional regulator n=1 Tax=Eiseniibacteriota bacterium TaxID=2212470 RepID=A0A956NB10_UNCEI|nr:YafY family transcriptional regulator [Candidatus Eisenbacteria bacterium]MCB9463500.1 YafY family transcriptional regulator [Candidatus Eisenbacteria bacterium]
MRRADRLFQIIQLLRGRTRTMTAARLAERLEVSERTIYRDIRDLMASGTPIEGEAGVGYTLRRDYDLPPLMFEVDELEAIVVGARLLHAFGDQAMARAAASAISKVEAVIPARVREISEKPPLYAPRTPRGENASAALELVRTALSQKRKLHFAYEDANGSGTERLVWPLGAFFWGMTWTLTSWCELREDFRTFRLDRMSEVRISAEEYGDEPGRTLRDFLRRLGGRAERLLDE